MRWGRGRKRVTGGEGTGFRKRVQGRKEERGGRGEESGREGKVRKLEEGGRRNGGKDGRKVGEEKECVEGKGTYQGQHVENQVIVDAGTQDSYVAGCLFMDANEHKLLKERFSRQGYTTQCEMKQVLLQRCNSYRASVCHCADGKVCYDIVTQENMWIFMTGSSPLAGLPPLFGYRTLFASVFL
ncbi:hypothetical protein Tco_0970235 [Tanacetum coccineum]